jgi:hypothetical protein
MLFQSSGSEAALSSLASRFRQFPRNPILAHWGIIYGSGFLSRIRWRVPHAVTSAIDKDKAKDWSGERI